MLTSLLTKETVQISAADDMDWKAAIKKAAMPLLKQEKINTDYIESMITVVEKSGPFINIGPDIALAHSRPENGVSEMGMALMVVNPAINLINKDHPIKLFFVLAASDNTKHLQALQELVGVLQNPENVNAIEKAESVDEILDQIKGAVKK